MLHGSPGKCGHIEWYCYSIGTYATALCPMLTAHICWWIMYVYAISAMGVQSCTDRDTYLLAPVKFLGLECPCTFFASALAAETRACRPGISPYIIDLECYINISWKIDQVHGTNGAGLKLYEIAAGTAFTTRFSLSHTPLGLPRCLNSSNPRTNQSFWYSLRPGLSQTRQQNHPRPGNPQLRPL